MLRTAKHAGLDAEMIISHSNADTLSSAVPSLRDELTGLDHGERLLVYDSSTREVTH